jgi:hypothetical protein
MKQILACSALKTFAICCLLFLFACSARPVEQLPVKSELGQQSLIQSREAYDFKLSDNHRVEISNSYGDIHVRENPQSGIRIELFIQRTGKSLPSENLTQVISDRKMTIQIEPGAGQSDSELLRIDLVAMIPPAPRLSLITTTGNIEAKKLHNPLIEASSKEGELRLTATSLLHARTEGGDIRATLMQPGWNGKHQLISNRGQIQAFIPLGPDLNLKAQAGESLRSEFKLDISDNGEGYFAQSINGNGRDAIVIQSTKGEVELFSLVFDPRVFGPASITSPQSDQTTGLHEHK